MEKKRHSVQLSKHPQTDEPLHFGSHYVVSSSEDVRINPNVSRDLLVIHASVMGRRSD